jgi:hypothetical protein
MVPLLSAAVVINIRWHSCFFHFLDKLVSIENMKVNI